MVEVIEHAVYAIRSAGNSETWNEAGVLDNLIGRSGSRANVFLSGYAAESAGGSMSGLDLDTYMRQLCGFTTARITDADCTRLIGAHGVPTLQLSEVSGFDESHHVEAEELYSQIEERRLRFNSFHHERQVMAEAEAVLLVQKFRQGLYTIDERTFDGSYFVSNSRFIDAIQNVGASGNDARQRIAAVARYGRTIRRDRTSRFLWMVCCGNCLSGASIS